MSSDAAGGPLTFLVVDDDIPLSLFFKETLQHAGHRVFVAVNEHGAIETVKNESVDILICDYLLPGIKGIGIVDIVKKMKPSLFCVLISGHHYHLINDRHTFTNADMVIAKPVLKESLNKILKQYLLTQSVRTQNL
ncbi:MAG: response regulator [Bacteroidetes bacterium]|nr:response regulator [Bacteroidota bacterium]